MGEFINKKPASNFHHAIRIAEVVERPLNYLVSINFGCTECQPDSSLKAFQRLRQKFGKWVTRPRVKHKKEAVAATFVWVLERPSNTVNAHWLMHIPESRIDEFKTLLPKWLVGVAGKLINDQSAIDIRPALTPRGAGKYMLKGMHPQMATYYGIRHESQGYLPGRRSGFTKNLGPKQKRRLRTAGKYPKARPWVPGMYPLASAAKASEA